jgi:hypothetical protein
MFDSLYEYFAGHCPLRGIDLIYMRFGCGSVVPTQLVPLEGPQFSDPDNIFLRGPTAGNDSFFQGDSQFSKVEPENSVANVCWRNVGLFLLISLKYSGRKNNFFNKLNG